MTTDVIDLNQLIAEFTARYGIWPRVFRAPGRINIIGEHTDYNEGFVLPCAIDLATYIAAAPRDDRFIRVASLNFEGEETFDLDDPHQNPAENWTKYVQGVGLVLEREGFRLTGADILVNSDIPVGAGLSSSAALEISTARALATLSGHKIDGMELARIGQAAEHEFAGVRSGIMDQFASVFGREGHALFLDCRSLEWSAIPAAGAEFIICNTGVKHDLAEGEYNKRRAECEEAARFFGQASLRDVTDQDLEERSDGMYSILRWRAVHVVSENRRVLEAVNALKRGDLQELGLLMRRSHETLNGCYQVSCEELDLMVQIACAQPGVLGARMMGGGFGGCTINLVKGVDIEGFRAEVSAQYEQFTGITPEIYTCVIADGARELQEPEIGRI